MVDEFFVIVTLGDSLTFGYRMRDPYAMDPRVPYPSQLEALLREKIKGRKQVVVVNAGVNGDDTEGMLRRFERDVTVEKPDLVVVWGGINDIGTNKPLDWIMYNLKKIYSKCEEIGAYTVACTITPTIHTSTRMRSLNDMIRAYASESGVTLADLFHKLDDGQGNLRQEYSDDGVHLTRMGYIRVAEIILEALIPFIEKSKA